MENEQKLFWNIDKLKNWEKNPRGIRKDDFLRLKRQIKRLGMYKPLLITEDGTVLGGNMRLRAYRELGVKEVWVNIVPAKTEAEMTEYALSDNDRAGFYEKEKVAELLFAMPMDFPREDYKLDLGRMRSLDSVMNEFGHLHSEMPEERTTKTTPQIIFAFASMEDFQRTADRLKTIVASGAAIGFTEALFVLLDAYEGKE